MQNCSRLIELWSNLHKHIAKCSKKISVFDKLIKWKEKNASKEKVDFAVLKIDWISNLRKNIAHSPSLKGKGSKQRIKYNQYLVQRIINKFS